MSALTSSLSWKNKIKEQYRTFKEYEFKSQTLVPIPVAQIKPLNLSKGVFGSWGEDDYDLDQNFRELQRQIREGPTPESKRKQRLDLKSDFDMQLEAELKRIENEDDNKTAKPLLDDKGLKLEDNRERRGDIDGRDNGTKIGETEGHASMNQKGKVEIDVDQDETEVSRTHAQEIAIDSESEGSIKGLWLDLNDKKATSKLLKKSLTDSEFHQTTFSKMLESRNNSPKKSDVHEAIPVEDEAIKNPEEKKQPSPKKPKEPAPLYIWPEPPKPNKDEPLNKWKKGVPKELLTQSNDPRNVSADLSNLKINFHYLTKYKRAMETVTYITPNKMKYTKNCKPDIFVKDLRSLGSYDHEESHKNRFKYLKNVISCDEKPKRKRVKKKKISKPKKKKERKFTVKMQNMYII